MQELPSHRRSVRRSCARTPPRTACRPASAGRSSTSPVLAARPRPAPAESHSGCDDPGLPRRMRVVNAVTTSWPALRFERPTFSAVAESELDAVHRYLLFLTGNRAVAEDLTGETFEKAFRVWRRFDPRRGTARAWLCGIARTTALDHFRSEERRRKREERFARDLPDTENPDLGPGELEAALGRLSPAEREVVALRVL